MFLDFLSWLFNDSVSIKTVESVTDRTVKEKFYVNVIEVQQDAQI
jgi:hypothetical protein